MVKLKTTKKIVLRVKSKISVCVISKKSGYNYFKKTKDSTQNNKEKVYHEKNEEIGRNVGSEGLGNSTKKYLNDESGTSV